MNHVYHVKLPNGVMLSIDVSGCVSIVQQFDRRTARLYDFFAKH